MTCKTQVNMNIESAKTYPCDAFFLIKSKFRLEVPDRLPAAMHIQAVNALPPKMFRAKRIACRNANAEGVHVDVFSS